MFRVFVRHPRPDELASPPNGHVTEYDHPPSYNVPKMFANSIKAHVVPDGWLVELYRVSSPPLPLPPPPPQEQKTVSSAERIVIPESPPQSSPKKRSRSPGEEGLANRRSRRLPPSARQILVVCKSCQTNVAELNDCDSCGTRACYQCREHGVCCKNLSKCKKCSAYVPPKTRRCASCTILVCSKCKQEDVCITCFKTMQQESVPTSPPKKIHSIRRRKPRILQKEPVSTTTPPTGTCSKKKSAQKSLGLRKKRVENNKQLFQTSDDDFVAEEEETEESSNGEKHTDEDMNDMYARLRDHLVHDLHVAQGEILDQLSKSNDDSRIILAKMIVDLEPDKRDKLHIPPKRASQLQTVSDDDTPIFYTETGELTTESDIAVYVVLKKDGVVLAMDSAKDLCISACATESRDGIEFAPGRACEIRDSKTDEGDFEVAFEFLPPYDKFCHPCGYEDQAELNEDAMFQSHDTYWLSITSALVMTGHLPNKVKSLLSPEYVTPIHEWERRFPPEWLQRSRFDQISSIRKIVGNARAEPNVLDGLEFYHVRDNWVWRTSMGTHIMEDFIMPWINFGMKDTESCFQLLQDVACRNSSLFVVEPLPQMVEDTCKACNMKRKLTFFYTLPNDATEFKIGPDCAEKLSYFYNIIQLMVQFRRQDWQTSNIKKLMNDLVDRRDAYQRNIRQYPSKND